MTGGDTRENTMLVIRYHLERERGTRRVALTVSRHCPTAVVRNRIRRWLREIYRTGRERLPAGDFIIIAKAGAVEADFSQLRRSFESLAQQLDR